MNPMLLTDAYKLGHILQYPQGTEYIYANFTPRSNRHFEAPEDFRDNKMVFFGLQAAIRKMRDIWNKEFFYIRDFDKIYEDFANATKSFMGDGSFPKEKMRELWLHGKLPIRIKALPEGSVVNIGVPVFTIINTDKRFYWLTNYLETYLSAELWKLCTSATTAYKYRQILKHWSDITGANPEFLNFQAHDFSMRGMSGCEDAIASGAAHLTCFYGTDSIASPEWIKKHYGVEQGAFLGYSVPATEHSVMCVGQEDGEKETIRRLIEDVYPNGIVSIVSDSWDFWKVIGEYARDLKPLIMGRNGKVVFRPDSGDPVKIICGDSGAPFGTPEFKGAVQILWETFGGTTNDKGYRTLDPHVGLIYGDSITMGRANNILSTLSRLGFASDNIVLGVGSYTYQRVTRDTLGFAVKATYGVVNSKPIDIVKCPKTDSGTKKSAAGLLRVEKEGDDFVLYDRQTPLQETGGCLKVVFENGNFYEYHSFEEIRDRLMEN